ncbi:MAG TPA: hypothetical protein VHN14_29560 [Kofleriaceae bacterium]|nr:hypothetical protein [Kofleriaceae bacterium]
MTRTCIVAQGEALTGGAGDTRGAGGGTVTGARAGEWAHPASTSKASLCM